MTGELLLVIMKTFVIESHLPNVNSSDGLSSSPFFSFATRPLLQSIALNTMRHKRTAIRTIRAATAPMVATISDGSLLLSLLLLSPLPSLGVWV